MTNLDNDQSASTSLRPFNAILTGVIALSNDLNSFNVTDIFTFGFMRVKVKNSRLERVERGSNPYSMFVCAISIDKRLFDASHPNPAGRLYIRSYPPYGIRYSINSHTSLGHITYIVLNYWSEWRYCGLGSESYPTRTRNKRSHDNARVIRCT